MLGFRATARKPTPGAAKRPSMARLRVAFLPAIPFDKLSLFRWHVSMVPFLTDEKSIRKIAANAGPAWVLAWGLPAGCRREAYELRLHAVQTHLRVASDVLIFGGAWQ